MNIGMNIGAMLDQHLDLVESLLHAEKANVRRRRREFRLSCEAVADAVSGDFQEAAEARLKAAMRLVRAEEAWSGIAAEAGRTRMAIIEREGRKFT